MNTRKKSMMFLVVLLASFVLSTHVYGQTKKEEPMVSTTGQTDKVEIKKEELPEAVNQALIDFKDWTVSKVYRVKAKEKDATGNEINTYAYEVEVKKADQTKVLMFDKEGNVKSKEG